jgi:general stress protein 26
LESGKTDELEGDKHINIAILTSSGEWASVSGLAEIITDREIIKKHYSRQLKAWLGDLGDKTHDGGPNDPRVGIIQVNTISATYSLTKGNPFTRNIEVAKGTVTGSPPDINKLREITKEEVAACEFNIVATERRKEILTAS